MKGKGAALLLLILHLQACRSTVGTVDTNPGPAHPPHLPNPVLGKTINVLAFGADPADSAVDDEPAIRSALLSAASGDEVYFPNGVYNLDSSWDSKTYRDTHILLASAVNLRGESESGVILKSSFNGGTFGKPSRISYSVIRALGVHDVHVSNLTLTSTWRGAYSTDPTRNNPGAGGPTYMIATGCSASDYSFNITLEHITVEKFRYMGFRIEAGSHDIVVKDCTARNATDVGGGGAGYGFVLQGKPRRFGSGLNPNLGTLYDNYFNTVTGCSAFGPCLRHAVLIQYQAHHNLVTECNLTGSIYGAVDLHGEDEYDNEISRNTISDVSGAGAIELGNSGAAHDRSGPGNWIHHNNIINCRDGIRVEYGTERALVEDNEISGNSGFPDGSGIRLGFCAFITVRRNYIHDNRAPGFAGILLARNRAENGSRAGSPSHCLIAGNWITANSPGPAVLILASEEGNLIEGNGPP